MRVPFDMKGWGAGDAAPATRASLFPWLWRVAERKGAWLAVAALLAFIAGIAVLAFSRSFMTYGTETDYLGGFMPEANRILAGEPLELDFHPPLYSFVIAAVWLVVRDWFTTGLIVSILSGAGLLAASYFLFRRMLGTAAGVGAALGLLASPIFISYSAFAASDMFFTFLYVAAFFLAVRALEVNRPRLWLACGLVLGLIVLTRTNGVAVLLLLIAPLLSGSGQKPQRAANLGFMALGLALPLGAWALYGLWTHSPLSPALTHGALAQTYYADPQYRYAGPVRRVFEDRFHGIWDVFAYDPAQVLKVYAQDLLILSRRIFYRDALLSFPFNHFVLPGLILLFLGRMNPAFALVAGGFVLHALLLNFKPFEGRFFLFLVPLLGAAAGILAAKLVTTANTKRAAAAAFGAVVLLAAGAIAQSLRTAYPQLHGQDALLADVVERAGSGRKPRPAVLALRPHLAFYLGGESVYVRRLRDLAQLKTLMSASAGDGPVYLYIGDDERQWWPVVKELARAENVPPWLTPLARGSAGQEWMLYEYRPGGLHSNGRDEARPPEGSNAARSLQN